MPDDLRDPSPIAASLSTLPQDGRSGPRTTARPSCCPGACVVDPVSRDERRTRCSGEVEVQTKRSTGNGQTYEWQVTMGLCAACSAREAENRRELADAAKSAAQSNTTRRASRKFDDE